MLSPDLAGYSSWFFVLIPAHPIQEGVPAIKCKVFAEYKDARKEIVDINFWRLFGLSPRPIYPEPVMGWQLEQALGDVGLTRVDLVLMDDPVGNS